jgi:hypothetical protein
MATTTDDAGREAALIRAATLLGSASFARDYCADREAWLGAQYARRRAEAEAYVGVCIARLRAALAAYDDPA